MKVLCYGDSNTYGYDPRGPIPGRYDADHRWCDLLAKNTGWTVINEGENGRKVPEPHWGYPVIRRALSDHAPVDAVCIMLGTNDILLTYRTDVTPIVKRMDALLDFLQNGWPGIQLILITPPPLDIPDFPESEEKLTALILAYEQLAKDRDISFINNQSWNIPLAYDGAHLTEEGNLIFAKYLERELHKCLEVSTGETF